VPPIRFDACSLSNGQFTALFSGDGSHSFVIWVSSNLLNWEAVRVLPASTGPLPFTDPDAFRFSRRFYRAISGTGSAQTLTDFESYNSGTTVMFRTPRYSGSTDEFLDASPNITSVTDTFPVGNGSARVLRANWSWNTTVNAWLRLTTFDTAILPNPTISTNQVLQFDIYCDRDLYMALGFRETSTSAVIGADGGTSGGIEWIGGTTDNTTDPPLGRLVLSNQWTSVQFFSPYEPVRAFTGNGVLETSTGKGVLEHLALVPANGAGAYTLYLDNFQVIDLP
jgi:hypothetical protein